jgi:hypothetical protein
LISICKDLPNGKGNVAEHANEAEITKNLFVIPNDGVSDNRPDHSKDEQATGIKEKAGGEIRKDEGEKETDSTDHFNHANETDDAGLEIFYPEHTAGECIDGLEKAIPSTKSKYTDKQDLNR